MSAASQDPLLDEAQSALARGRAREAETLCTRLIDANPRSAAAWHLLGLARQKLGRSGDAVQALTKASSLDRGTARYHHDLGNALADDAKLDQAISSYRRALRIDDSPAEVHNDLGTAYYQKGWYAEAESCFRKATELKPDHGIAHANLGAALRAQGRLHDGRREYQRALILKLRALLPGLLQWRVASAPTGPAATLPAESPGVAPAIQEISGALSAGRLKEALALAQQAEKRFPENPDVLYAAATVREAHGELGAALSRIDAAIGRKPERAEYQMARARLLVSGGRQEEAMKAAARGLKLEPGSADVHAILAAVHWKAANPQLAEQAARRAVEIDPRCHLGHSNLATALWSLGLVEEAEKHAREALKLSSGSIHYLLNLALVLKDAGKLDEARQLYRDASSRSPGDPSVLLNLGALALECDADLDAARGWYRKCQSLGEDFRATMSDSVVDLLDARYDVAWPKYEARKLVEGHRERHAPFSAFPAWNGEPLGAQRLLVYGEQGLGDEIMFASMIPAVQKRSARVTLACDSRLGNLFARSFPGVVIAPAGRGEAIAIDPAPEFAVAAGSLGMFFRHQATDFPVHRGYLLPDEHNAARWRERLSALGSGRRIGISWSGGVFSTGRARRSMALSRLRPLLDTPDTVWVSVQYGNCADEIAAFTEASGIPVHGFPGVADDMDELASAIQALDLVISVCNTTVHVAGAIGKEVLVMAPFLPEWRYGLRGERMLWYPSARIFRQPVFGDWDSVISAVKATLA